MDSSAPPPEIMTGGMLPFGPPGTGPNRGPAAVGIAWTETSIAIIVIAVRFWSRALNRAIGPDDWTMLIALIISIWAAATIVERNNLDGFRHVWDIAPMSNLGEIGFSSMLFQTANIISIIFSKLSVGLFLLRIVPSSSKYQRAFIWAITLFTVAHNVAAVITNWFTCTPTAKIWNPTMPGTCWSNTVKMSWIYPGLAFNVAADFIFALWPLPMVLGLNMDLKRRIRICALMSGSLVAGICTIMKIVEMKNLTNTVDFTWVTWDLYLWSFSEVFVIIVCGSAPALKPWVDRYILGKRPNQTGYSGGYDRGTVERSSDRVNKIQAFKSGSWDRTDSSRLQLGTTASAWKSSGDRDYIHLTEVQVQ